MAVQVCYFIFALYIILFLLSRREPIACVSVSAAAPPRIFMRMAALLVRKLGGGPQSAHRKMDAQAEEELNRRYPGGAQNPRDCYRRDKLAYALMIAAIGTLLSFSMCVSSRQNGQTVQSIARGSYGSAETVTLTARLGTALEEWEETIDITVGGREYTKEEIDHYMEEIRAALPNAVLGQNEDIDHVTEPLVLMTQMPDNPVIIKWRSSDYGLMDSRGNIQALDIAEEGELCMLTAELSCQGYEAEERFYVRICRGERTEKEQLQEAVREALRQKEEEERTDDRFVLPQEIGGNKVVWLRKESDTSVVILLLALALAAGVYFAFDNDLKKQIQKRKRHLLTQYPEFVSRLVLLMGAGMTIRGAMHQMACDDERRKLESDGGYQGRSSAQDAARAQRFSSDLDGDRKKRRRAAEDTGIGVKAGKRAATRKGTCGVRIYEEIAYTCRELDSGISEAKAYYRLGRRCGEAHYVRLCMLLSQNLKKGTAGLLILLEQEAADAFEERKRNARRFGEEAGTKLLVPMMIMLVIVMVMIMVPAFLSFSA